MTGILLAPAEVNKNVRVQCKSKLTSVRGKLLLLRMWAGKTVTTIKTGTR